MKQGLQLRGAPRRTGGWARWIPWLGLGCVFALQLGAQVVAAGGGIGVDPFALVVLPFPIVGALIASRHPRNAIGWIMLSLGIGSAVADAFNIYAYYALRLRPGSVPGAEVLLALNAPMWIPFIGLAGTFLILLFPDGHLPSPAWRPWAYFCAGAMLLCYFTLLVLPGDFTDAGYPEVENPLGVAALDPYLGAIVAVVVLIPIAIVGCAVAVVRRFRRSRGRERDQMKWLAAAASVVAASYLLLMALNLPWIMSGETSPPWVDVVSNLGVFTFVLLPISIGVAILRHRLYDIDVIINRTLVYGMLTATLTAAYFVVVTTLQGVLRPIAGESEVAVAGSTLAVAAIFRPARARIQSLVDRRFYRAKYDAETTLERFSARLRQEVDLAALTADLLGVLDNTIKPATASLWLRPTAFGRASAGRVGPSPPAP